MNKRFSLKYKVAIYTSVVFLIVFAIFIAITIFNSLSQQEYVVNKNKELLLKGYDDMIRTQVENVITLIESHDKFYEKQGVPIDKRKEAIKEIIRDIRYQENGYFGIDTTEGVSVMQPNNPKIEGMDKMGLKDAKGVLVEVEIVDICNKHGEGFIDYWFPKMKDQDEVFPKRAYLKVYKKYNWIVGTGNYIDEIDVVVEKEKSEMRSQFTQRLIMISIVILVLFVIMTIVFISLSIRRFVDPIIKTSENLKNIAQGDGDLTSRLKVKGNNEVTDLSLYFNQTMEKIGRSIESVSKSTGDMTETGRALSTNMTDTAKSLSQISSSIQSVKNQTSEQNSSISRTRVAMEDIIKTIQDLNRNIEKQAENIAKSSSSTEEMVANITSVKQTLEKSDKSIQDLATQTNKGKEMIKNSNLELQKVVSESGTLMEASEVIQNIASQTNLLAMNAGIEASHAGNAGRGFAVVADEIRKLSEESNSQGKAITTSLKNLREGIEAISKSSQSLEGKFGEIFNLAKEVKDMSSLLTTAMKEQEMGSNEVISAIGSINTVTDEVKYESDGILENSEQIAKEMHKIENLSQTITENMDKISSETGQINNAVDEVNALTQRNNENINILSGEVEGFKLQ